MTLPMMNEMITIRQLADYSEFLACEDIQRLAWKMSDDRDVVPAHVIKPIADHGGIVLGAFNGESRLVGFVFGFVGRLYDERADWMGTPYILCSEMMGVLPEYRNQAVGYRLKLAQRDYALSEGYKLVVWTYDPLLSLNANLNISKLGCICRHYVEDAYGQMGGIYAGVSTDRFAVEWWIGSQRVSNRIVHPPPDLTGEAWLKTTIPVINRASVGKDGLLRPGNSELVLQSPRVLVEVPTDFQNIKQADAGLAREWRAHTRMIFENAFAKGHVVMWFARGASGHPGSSFYVLEKDPPIQLMAEERDEQ